MMEQWIGGMLGSKELELREYLPLVLADVALLFYFSTPLFHGCGKKGNYP
jgi:hypothetical protein